MTPSSFETLIVELDERTARIIFDRADAMNAISPAMADDLDRALDEILANPQIRCIILTATGRSFCAGADLKAVKAAASGADPEQASQAFLTRMTKLLQRIETLPVPVIAAVNGLALAGGLEIALVCDLVIAADTAKFGDAHARYGLLPGWGASARLPRKIGANRAKYLMFTARHVPAAMLMDWGLVNEVHSADALQQAADALAAQIVDKSPLGIRRMKQLVDEGLDQPLAKALAAEADMVARHNQSFDRHEGLEAFTQKRIPQFRGE